MYRAPEASPSPGRLSSEAGLWDLGNVLLRHKTKVVLCFLTVMTAVALWTVYTPKVYRAEGKLFLRLGRENVTLDPTVMTGTDTLLSIPQSRETELNSVADVLRSRPLVEKVVEALGPSVLLGKNATSEPEGAPVASAEASGGGLPAWADTLRQSLLGAPLDARESACVQLIRGLEAAPIRKTNIVSLTYEGQSPEISRQVVGKLIEFYLEEHIRLNRSPGAHQFLRDETDRLRGELTKAQERLRDMKNSLGLASSESQRDMLTGRIGRLREDLLRTESHLDASQAKVRQLAETLSAVPEREVALQTSGHSNEGTDNMRAQFFGLKVREHQLAAKYSDAHPALQELRKELAEAERTLAREEPTRSQVTTGKNKAYEQAELAALAEKPVLASLKAEAEAMRRQLADSQKDLEKLNQAEVQLAAAQRDIDLLETNYRRYAANLEKARIDEALESQRISNVTVMQPAMVDMKPVSPRPMRNLALGFVAAVFGSVFLALTADRFKRRVRGPEEEKRRDLPVRDVVLSKHPR